MKTTLRKASPRTVKACLPVSAPCSTGVQASPVTRPAQCEIPAPPASQRRVRKAPAAPPPVVAPRPVEVHVLSWGRAYVTFSGEVGSSVCRVTYSRTGYVRLVPAPEARRIYADLLSRGYVVPGRLISGTAA